MKARYIKTLIMAVLVLTISSAAKAQKTSDIINSGEDFLAVCQYDNNRPPDVCLAYVAGVAGTLALNWFLVAQVTIKKYVCEARKPQAASAPAPVSKVSP